MKYLLLICVVLLGCVPQDETLAKQREEFKAILASAPVETPPEAPQTPPAGSPVPTTAPSTQRAAVVYLATGHGWCPPCIRWAPQFETAFQDLAKQGYSVRIANRTRPNPAHFVELVYPLDKDGEFIYPTPVHNKLHTAVGGLKFPCFYAVSSDWKILRSWSPDDAAEVPWEGSKTLLWLLNGK